MLQVYGDEGQRHRYWYNMSQKIMITFLLSGSRHARDGPVLVNSECTLMKKL